jgi:TolB-like protein/DNA-binding SARP family transcriptional activator/Tfp pilus assembly protein PilF
MTLLRLHLLGDFEMLDAAGQRVDISARKGRALLAVIALSPSGSVSRQRLANLLWGDRADEQARGSLRQTLSALRRDLAVVDSQVLSGDDATLRHDPAIVGTDVADFKRLALSDDLGDLRSASTLWRGELLADIAINVSEFDEWLSEQRSRLHSTAVELFERLWELESGQGRITVARTLTTLEPLRESAHRMLMQAFAEAGENGLALQHYAECRDLLKRELDIAPGAQIEELRRAILEKRAPALGPAVIRSVQEMPNDGPTAIGRLPNKPSIAVLPFVNLSGDAQQDYFADGVVEEMITALSRFSGLFVIARNSSFAYKGQAVDIKKVGQELGVRYVLEGSMRRSADRVRIAGQLIDAVSGMQLWADRFDGPTQDIFELQDKVTSNVVGALAPRLELAEIERANHKPTDSLDAYDHFLRGVAGLHRWSLEGNSEALSHFHSAIELDPNFAAAHGLAARALVQRNSGGWTTDLDKDRTEALRLARRAIEIGQGDALALCTAGFALADICRETVDGDAWINRALELNPNLAMAWLYSGWVKASIGQPDLALEHLSRAKQLSPNDPLAFSLHSAEAFAHFVAARYDEALTCANVAMRSRPSFLLAILLAAVTAALGDQTEEARKAVARLRILYPDLRMSNSGLYMQEMRPQDLARWEEGLRKAGLPD